MTSRLDGNGRWGTKWSLTEQQQMHESRGQQPPAGRPTPEEIALIRDSVILPHMLSIVDRSLAENNRSENAMKTFIAVALQFMMDKISLELFQVRRNLKQSNIRLLNEEQQDDIIYYKYVCRGYEEKFGFVREVVRAELNKKMAEFASAVLNNPNKH